MCPSLSSFDQALTGSSIPDPGKAVEVRGGENQLAARLRHASDLAQRREGIDPEVLEDFDEQHEFEHAIAERQPLVFDIASAHVEPVSLDQRLGSTGVDVDPDDVVAQLLQDEREMARQRADLQYGSRCRMTGDELGIARVSPAGVREIRPATVRQLIGLERENLGGNPV